MKRDQPSMLSKQRAALLEKRMLTYALGAAGAMLAAQPAHASIVFTSAHQTITPGTAAGIDLNNDGTQDFVIRNFETGSSSFYVSNLTVSGGIGGLGKAVGQATRFGASAWDLPSHFSIGPNSPRRFVTVQGRRARMASGVCLFQCYPQGPWGNATNKFLGFQFTVNGGVHYGWARLSVTLSHKGLTAMLTGYAYETQPDTAILAGDRGPVAELDSADAPDTGPTLALLSLGSAGLDAWRRED